MNLTGKDLILATKPFAKENRVLSWYYTISTLLLLMCAITITLLVNQIFVRVICSVLEGLLIGRMFVIYHDHQHHAILYKSKLANAIMAIYGIYGLAPTSIWKRSHDHHHKHNSKLFCANIGSYPIATKAKYLSMPPQEKRMYLASRHPLTILGGYFSMFLIGICLNSFLSDPKRHWDSLLAIIAHISISATIFYFLGWQAWFFTMIVPFLISGSLGAYLFYAQHNFPSVHFTGNSEWKYEHAALQSSSYIPMNSFMRWMTASIGYHHVHHLNSRIPFYRLKEAMEHIPELQNPKVTKLTPRDIAACLRLKFWDQDNKKMIGFLELNKKERKVSKMAIMVDQ